MQFEDVLLVEFMYWGSEYRAIQDYFIISSEKLKHGWTLTTSQYTITHIIYFKTQKTVVENTKVT